MQLKVEEVRRKELGSRRDFDASKQLSTDATSCMTSEVEPKKEKRKGAYLDIYI